MDYDGYGTIIIPILLSLFVSIFATLVIVERMLRGWSAGSKFVGGVCAYLLLYLPVFFSFAGIFSLVQFGIEWVLGQFV